MAIDVIAPDGTAGSIPEEQQAAALAQGYKLAAPPPEAAPPPAQEAPAAPPAATTIDVLAPDGTPGTIPAEQQEAALQAGYTLAPTTPANQGVDTLNPIGTNLGPTPQDVASPDVAAEERAAAQADVEKRGISGLKPVIGKTADIILGKAEEHLPFLHVIKPAEEQAIDTYAQQAPVAKTIGVLGGELLGANLLGKAAEVVKGAEATTLAGKLTQQAIEGAVYSSPQVVEHLEKGDPKGAAEALGIGIIANLGFHGLLSAGGAITEKLAAKVAPEVGEVVESAADKEERLAANTLMKAWKIRPSQLDEFREHVPGVLEQAGITAKDDVPTQLQKIQKFQESGSEIGKAIKELDTVEGKEPVIAEHLQKAHDEISNLIPEVAEHKTLQAAAEETALALQEAKGNLAKAVLPESKALAQEELNAAMNAAKEAKSKLANFQLLPNAEQANKALQPILKQIAGTGEKGTFEALQAAKKFVREQTNFGADTTFANNLRKQAGGILSKYAQAAEDQVAALSGKAQVVSALKTNRLAWFYEKAIGDAVDLATSKEVEKLPGWTSLIASHHAGRHTALGILGHLVGGPVGGAIAMGTSVLGGMLKHRWVEQAPQRAVDTLLGKSANPGTTAVLHALERQKNAITDGVSSLFQHFKSGVGAAAPLATQGSVKYFLSDNGVGHTHDQQVKELRATIAKYTTDPKILSDHLGATIEPLKKEGLHNVAQEYTQYQLRVMQAIQNVLPADPKEVNQHPFAPKVDADAITPDTKAKYERALTLAAQPEKLFDMVKDHTISQSDINLVAFVNPGTLQKMRTEAYNEALKSKPDLSYQQRLSMGVLLGEKLDQSLDQLPAMQAAYAQGPASSPPPAGAIKGKGSKGAGFPSMATNLQKSLNPSWELTKR